MKRFITTLLLAGVPLAASAQVPEGDLAQLLPEGTMVFASIADVDRIVMLDQDGAIMTLLEHEAVRQAFETAYSLIGDLEDQEFLLALDLEEEELARLFNGRIMAAIPEILLEESEVAVTGPAAGQVSLSLALGRGLVMMADFGATRDRLETLLENVTKLREEDDQIHTSQVVSYEFEGMLLYNLEELDIDYDVNDSLWLALIDELLIFSTEEETLKDFADLARNGAPDEDRLSDDPRYIEALDHVGVHDALVYINLGELLPLINDLIEYQIKKLGMMVEMFVRAEDLVASLQLDAVKSMFFSAHVDDDEADLVFGFTHADTEFGLHTLLTYGDGGVEIPGYFSTDFHSASISLFDFSASYDAFDKLLLKASPQGHTVLQMQIDTIEEEGFDLIDALLNNLDSQFVEVLGYPESSAAGPDTFPTQAYVVRIKDPQSQDEALGALGGDLADEAESIEFMNEQIQVLPNPMSGILPGSEDSKLCYAVVGNHLVLSIGETKMVENMIAHLKNPGESLLDDSDLMDGFDAMPSDDVVALGFVDVADLLSNLLRAGNAAVDAQFPGFGEPAPPDLETLMEIQEALDAVPDVSDIKYYIVSKTYKSYDAFVQRMLLRPNLDQ
jgi:hypothetical protein